MYQKLFYITYLILEFLYIFYKFFYVCIINAEKIKANTQTA